MSIPDELKDKVKEVRSWMIIDGDMDRVAAKARKSRRWVQAVLNGHTFNAQIVEAGIEVMEENRARFQCNKSNLRIA